MTKGVKIFLGVGCGLLAVVVVVIIIGVLALNYLERTVGQSMEKYANEGREYGRTTDQQGCMNEGMKRSKSVGVLDIGGALELSTFVDACLETSKPTSNFCDGVPSFWSMEETEWGAAQCRKAGIDPEKTGCVHVTKRKHQFCSKPL